MSKKPDEKICANSFDQIIKFFDGAAAFVSEWII